MLHDPVTLKSILSWQPPFLLFNFVFYYELIFSVATVMWNAEWKSWFAPPANDVMDVCCPQVAHLWPLSGSWSPSCHWRHHQCPPCSSTAHCLSALHLGCPGPALRPGCPPSAGSGPIPAAPGLGVRSVIELSEDGCRYGDCHVVLASSLSFLINQIKITGMSEYISWPWRRCHAHPSEPGCCYTRRSRSLGPSTPDSDHSASLNTDRTERPRPPPPL